MADTDPPETLSLNEKTPPQDAPVAVEWWYGFDASGEPELDRHHGFHDAERVTDGDPPRVQGDELVTGAGDVVTAESDTSSESRYLYLTHREALARDITPCVECFPVYATELKLAAEREDDGILTEPGVTGAVFPVWTRYDKDAKWDLDSVHDSYTSLLYRISAIREHVGSAGDRLRYSYMPTRRCDYTTVADAAVAEPRMAHVSELRTIQPTDLEAVRKRVGKEVLGTPVEYEHRYTDTVATRAPLVHRATDAPCGFEYGPPDLFDEEPEDEIRELFDSESQTVADVIEGGNVVEFCEECFPELAAWDEEPDES